MRNIVLLKKVNLRLHLIGSKASYLREGDQTTAVLENTFNKRFEEEDKGVKIRAGAKYNEKE